VSKGWPGTTVIDRGARGSGSPFGLIGR